MAGKRDEVTIAEVAEALNISKTTVSRAISGKGRVSEATRARVFDYIGKGRQDAAAPLRTAQQGPTNNLALVIPKHFMRLDLPFLRKCMGGVWNMAAQRGYDLLLCYAGETDVGQLERQLESHKVDGVILSRTMLHDECVQTLQRHNVPFVAIGRVDDDKVPQVDNDQVGATAEMTRLLLQLGDCTASAALRDGSVRVWQEKALAELDAMQEAQRKAALPDLELEPFTQEDVDFDTFCRSDFRAVKIKACEAVKKSDKLLKFTLDDGSGTDRTIVSGIHHYYEPEDLVGKTAVAILNLPPRKMMGIPSCGMLISAVHKEKGEEKLHLLLLDDSIPAGAKLC